MNKRKTLLLLFSSWGLPALLCTLVAAVSASSVGVAAAVSKPSLTLSSYLYLWRADDNKSFKRLLQEDEVQTVGTEGLGVHDHAEEEGHDDHDHEDAHIDHAEDDHDDDHDHDHDNHNDHEDDHKDEHGHDHDDHDDEHLHGAETMSAENVSVSNLWGSVIGATLLVNLATFSGVLLLVIPAIKRGYLNYKGISGTSEAATVKGRKLMNIAVPGFAVGALIATSVFLIFPEALHFIEGGHEDHDDHDEGHGHRYLEEDDHEDHGGDGEGVIAAKFGCSILGGFLLPFFFSIFFHASDEDIKTADADQAAKKNTDEDGASAIGNESECDSCVVPEADAETGVIVAAVQQDNDSDNAAPAEAPIVKTVVNKMLCATILIGDCFHNFADGLFIAAAFRSCSQQLAAGIMLVTLAHEIPQELADFVVLTQFAGLSAHKALILNFVSGLSVLFGGLIFLAANPSAEVTGVILAMGGGVYINAAACETIPCMEQAIKVRWDRALMLLSIILGAIPIGLILIDHKHCD